MRGFEALGFHNSKPALILLFNDKKSKVFAQASSTALRQVDSSFYSCQCKKMKKKGFAMETVVSPEGGRKGGMDHLLT